MPTPNPQGMWSETCFIQVAVSGGSNMEGGGKIVSANINFGAKDFESIPTSDGGRLIKFIPQEDVEVEFEGHFLEAGTISGTSLLGVHDLIGTTDADAANPTIIRMSRNRVQCRVAFLWTNDTSANSADDAVTGSSTVRALRMTFADGFFTEVSNDWAPGDALKFTFKYKTPPFDASGNTNVLIESVTLAAQSLTALGAYTAGSQNGKFYSGAPS